MTHEDYETPAEIHGHDIDYSVVDEEAEEAENNPFAEDGIYGRPAPKLSPREAAHAAAHMAARAYAKTLGFRAMTGTMRQKAWGETLRANYLKALPDAAPEIDFLRKNAGKAKDWIEHRTDIRTWVQALMAEQKRARERVAAWEAAAFAGYQQRAAVREAAWAEALGEYAELYSKYADKLEPFKGSTTGDKLCDGMIDGKQVRVFRDRSAPGALLVMRGSGQTSEAYLVLPDAA